MMHLKLGFFPNSVWSIIKRKVQRGEESDYEIEGAAALVADYLSKAMNFSYTFHFSEDFNFGTELDNGSWIGNLAYLYDKRVDMMVSTVYLTERRHEVFRATHVIDIMSTQILSSSQFVAFTNFAHFMKGMQKEVWASFCLLLIVSISVTTLKFKYRTNFHVRNRYLATSFAKHLQKTIWMHLRSIFQTSVPPRRLIIDIRLNFGLWILGTFVIMKALSGTMKSVLIQEQELNVINSIEDLLLNTNIELYVPEGDDFNVLKKTLERKKIFSLIEYLEEVTKTGALSYEKLLDRKIYDDVWDRKVAIIYYKTFLQSFISSFCGTFEGRKRFVFSETSYYPMPIVFLVRKDFPHSHYGKLNECILRLQENSLILRDLEIRLKKYRDCEYVQEVETTILGVRHVYSSLKLFVYLLNFSILGFFLEVLMYFIDIYLHYH